MKKKKMKVEKKTKEVERVKCDDCGVVGEDHEFNVLSLDTEIVKKYKSFRSTKTDRSDWGDRISTLHDRLRFKISPTEYIDLCDECLDKHLHDGEEHEKDTIDRELERATA